MSFFSCLFPRKAQIDKPRNLVCDVHLNFPKSLITFYWTQKSCFVSWFETNTSEQTRTQTNKGKCASEQTKNTNKHKQKSSTQKKNK
jgi:hypothetical protein